MRAISVAAVACALLISNPAAANPPMNADEAVSLKMEALSDRSPERWQGRQYYLYDDDHQPNAETVGSGASDAAACEDQPVRMRRSDGTTVVRSINRCR
jgi:hypothetical protein